ncbi:CubicO group peptidase (beta-lactamase class C family) [Microbacterium sp. W4I4]|uniref:serine hydrolase domain-containing protein n=1 Tax=Microbacterium sp. W4I4 TaxID=3042295 RepID=UPI002785E721|nr:serine hydrolase domain-containing protein [Microbacterium sp. W4I4]MDQ0614136.1 CubicO group peptidase (beta-lactamase class C family) [Microbacterium sp. W4I4]
MTVAVDELTAHAREALAAQLDDQTLRRAPACIAAVTYRGRTIAVSAHGEPRGDGAMTIPGTVFRIASMSKSFLAAAVLALRDEGRLDLQAPVSRYVPELATARFGDDVDGDALTLDAALRNAGGLGEDNAWGDEHLGESREFMSAVVGGGLTLATRPGTVYNYSNLGISFAGRAIEAVTGRSVEDVVRDKILAPLGLVDTRASAELYPTGTDLALGYRTFDDGTTFTPEPYVGTGALGCIGSLFSTVSDIAAWMHFLGSAFDGADAERDAVLRAESRRQMQSVQTLIAPTSGQFGDRVLDGAGYGYGLVVEHDRRFGRVVQHAGGLPGFSSHMRWHPTTGIGVVVFGNSDAFSAGRVAGHLLSDVLRRIDAPAAIVRPWSETLEAAERLDAMIRSGAPLHDPTAWELGGLFARNVLRDVPAAVRTRRLREAVAETGSPLPSAAALSVRVLSAPDAATLRWTVPCVDGALVCDVRLMGLHAPVVQSLDVRVAEETGKPRDEAAQVIDHHRADLT